MGSRSEGSKHASVPLSRAPYTVAGGEVVPHYLTERDHPWLRDLLGEFDAFVNRPRRKLEAQLHQCRFLATARHAWVTPAGGG